MRILIAEDEPGTSETYRLFLEDEGYKVTVTKDGEECLEAYAKNPLAYDVLILDYCMPLKDGKAVLREVLNKNPNQKVLLASAYPKPLIKEMGVDDAKNLRFLQKPFEPQMLLDSVSELFYSRSE